jgi:hypothetical protein
MSKKPEGRANRLCVYLSDAEQAALSAAVCAHPVHETVSTFVRAVLAAACKAGAQPASTASLPAPKKPALCVRCYRVAGAVENACECAEPLVNPNAQ